ncbi:glycosyltransferase [Roseobacter sp. HKCCA0882]|uniref:glycosyltransferase n=1 Tax=Roseobacter sp. HKCCA0882 TaxID=3120337 RepID=UPI0030EF9B8D
MISQDANAFLRFRANFVGYLTNNGVLVKSYVILPSKSKSVKSIFSFDFFKILFAWNGNQKIYVVYGSLPILFFLIFQPFSRKIIIFTGLGSIFNNNLKIISFPLINFLLLINIRYIKKVVFLNESDRDIFFKNVHQIKKFLVNVLPGEGVDFDKYRLCDPDQRKDVLPSLGFVSRLTYEKGFSDFKNLVRDLVLIKRNFPYRQLFLMGSNSGLNPSRIGAVELQDFISENGITHIENYDQADAIVLMSKIDIICLLSKHEGVPFVLLEALRTASIIILSDIHAHRAVFRDACMARLGIVWAADGESLSRCYVQAWRMHQSSDVQSLLASRSAVLNKLSAGSVWPQWRTNIFS